jgi:cysteine synthase A
MSDNRSRLYIGIGFLAGVLLTLGFKDVYPDLERRFRRRLRQYSTTSSTVPTIKAGHHGVQLEDHTDPNTTKHANQIPEGIEGCIGNTPLFKIRSLSEVTGCEILVKAEARLQAVIVTAILIFL